MRVVNSVRANPICQDDGPVEPLTIIFAADIPDHGGNLHGMAVFYAAEAVGIVAAIRAAVPGGLFDALAVEFLRAVCTVRSVPHADPRRT